MSEYETRDKVVTFKVSDDEYEFIKKKAELAGSKNLSCYLRKMAIAGMVIKYDDEQLNEMKKDISRIGYNINQISVRVNKNGTLYYDDLQEIKGKVNDLWQSLISIQSTLQLRKQ